MSDAKVKVGILGAGAMGGEHAYCLGEIENAEVAGVFSRNRERAEAAAKACNAEAVSDPFALISDGTIDAIDVCLPSANHREFVIAALAQGKHVFCETPFALRLDDAEAMIEAARKSKTILMVGLLMRSAAHYEHVHNLAASGELGKILSVVTFRLGSYLRPGAPDHKEHYSEPSTELMTFDFDFVQWLLGRPLRLTASAVSMDGVTPGEISAILDYEDSRTATVLASGIMPVSFPFSAGFRVVFERGAFELSTVFEDGPPKSTFTLFPERGAKNAVAVAGHNPYEKELRHFIACIRREADPDLLAPERALEALQLSLATQQSLREHKSVDLIAF
jgi:UDP-N-acetylglucosamine 3-dehydrogenase